MDFLLIFTHLLAALIPILLLLAFLAYRRHKQNQDAIQRFWKNQSPGSLQAAGIQPADPARLAHIPPPFALVLEGETVGVNVQALAFARKLGLLDYIGQHPGLSEAEIAAHFNFDVPPLRIALELLTASGALCLDQDGYALSEAARLYLLEDSPLAMMLPPPVMNARVLKLLRRGETTGSGRQWRKGQAHRPEYWAIKQHVISFPLGFALASRGWLAGAKEVLDVAGGAGSVAVALASQYPGMHLHLLELPGSLPIAERFIAQYGLSQRITCTGQDMFSNQPWPASGELDAVLFTNIFHDWDLAGCQLLAEKAFAALKPGGRVLIQEALLNDDQPGPVWTAAFSLSLAMNTYGRQYRRRELQPLLERAGFSAVQVHPLLGYYSTLAGEKPAAAGERQAAGHE